MLFWIKKVCKTQHLLQAWVISIAILTRSISFLSSYFSFLFGFLNQGDFQSGPLWKWLLLSSLATTGYILSRPGQIQRLLYKHLCHSLINWFIHPFPPTDLQRRHAQTIWDSSSIYKIDYVIVRKNIAISLLVQRLRLFSEGVVYHYLNTAESI